MIKRKHYRISVIIAIICCFGVLGLAQAQEAGSAERGIILPAASPWALAAMGVALAFAGAFVVWRLRKIPARQDAD